MTKKFDALNVHNILFEEDDAGETQMTWSIKSILKMNLMIFCMVKI